MTTKKTTPLKATLTTLTTKITKSEEPASKGDYVPVKKDHIALLQEDLAEGRALMKALLIHGRFDTGEPTTAHDKAKYWLENIPETT